MKKAGKTIAISLFLITIILLPLVAAANVDNSTWYGAIIEFLGFGETWQQVFVSIFIALIIGAATYDILGLTAFRSNIVKILIGIGLAGIVSIVGGTRAIAGFAFTAAGAVSAVGIATVIIIAVVAFLLIHFGISFLAVRMIKARGEVEAEEAAAKARIGASVLRGARTGTE